MPLPVPCYLEDFVIGERAITGSVTVSESDIVTFAKQFDPQPFHTDPVAAVNTALHGLAASGVVQSFRPKLFVPKRPTSVVA